MKMTLVGCRFRGGNKEKPAENENKKEKEKTQREEKEFTPGREVSSFRSPALVKISLENEDSGQLVNDLLPFSSGEICFQ